MMCQRKKSPAIRETEPGAAGDVVSPFGRSVNEETDAQSDSDWDILFIYGPWPFIIINNNNEL